jgi:gliding motility-associated-like protein
MSGNNPKIILYTEIKCLTSFGGLPMLKIYVLFFITLVTLTSCYAQVDTEFWFAPPEATSGHGDRPVFIRISTLDKAATVQISQPANSNLSLASLTIPPNTTYTADLTNRIDVLETNIPASVMRTGVKITSTAPVTAYYEVGSPWNSEIFVLKGKNALGNKFVIAGQNLYDNSNQYFPTPYSSFDVVATKNNTVVTVRPTKPIFGHTKDTVITVKLNEGETYSFRKTTQFAADNPVGTVVESSKPIAVTIKDDSVIDGACRDIIGDQIVPLKVAGMEYVVSRGFLNTDEYLFVTATENNTSVYFEGATKAVVLQAGQLFRYRISSAATYVLADKTIYLFHATGFGCELGMALLPSINCKGSQQIGFTRSTSEFFGLNVLVRKEGIADFKLNNSSSAIAPSAFTPVRGTNDKWYTAQLSFSTGQIPVGQASQITNDRHSFQVGIINGNAMTTCRYGYFSAFSTLFIGDDFKFCEGETATIDAGSGKESYLWSTGATTQQIDISTSGTYWVKAIKEECTLYDTIVVEVRKGKEDLGPDIQLCKDETAKIDGKNNFSWKWSDGTTQQYLITSAPGKYWVSVFDNTGCAASDTVLVNWYARPPGDFGTVKINYVSVDTLEEKDIHLSWTVSANAAVQANNVFLFKKNGDSDWQKFSSLPANRSSVVDEDNDTDNHLFEYQVSLVDHCSEEVVKSDIHNTIVLTGVADTVADMINFSWNPYRQWAGGVQRYELWRQLDNSQGYTFIAEIPGDQISFSAQLAADGFHHRYVLRALQSSGNSESWSNNLEIEVNNTVYIPNVFTPNHDPTNQYFEIKKIQLYKHAELVVMDRWGKKVFESHNYNNDWDGDDLAAGVYYYVLHLNRNNKVFKGVVSILK